MTDYRDPKVTTPRGGRAAMTRWIGLAVGAVVVLVLLGWLLGGSGEPDPTTATEPASPAATTEPAEATAPPASTEPADAEPADTAAPAE